MADIGISERPTSREAGLQAKEFLKRISVTIEGTAPLMFNKMSEDAKMEIYDQSRGAVKSTKKKVDERTKREICQEKMYLDSEGKPYVPVQMLLSTLSSADSFIKIGSNKKSSKEDKSPLTGAISFEESAFPISPGLWEPDLQVVPNSWYKGRVKPVLRPKFDTWTIQFVVILNTKLLSEDACRDIFDTAFRAIGIGAGRVENRGRCGSGTVKTWKILSD